MEQGTTFSRGVRSASSVAATMKASTTTAGAGAKTPIMSNNATRALLYGTLASSFLLGAYFAVLTLVSGWDFAQGQFADFRYFIVSLAVGFGIQAGLYAYLRSLITGSHGEGKMLGVTGTTSTAAMISCCTHYLANLLPILGTVGIVTFVAQYQVELFWVGLLFNLGGVIYTARRVIAFKRI